MLHVFVAVFVSATPAIALAGPAADKPAADKPAAGEPAGEEVVEVSDDEGGDAPAPPATEPPPAPTTSGATPDAPAEDAATKPTVRESEIYGDRLDGLQNEVNDLKDKIFRSKARLALLRETVLRGVLAGSRIILAHRNLMGSSFRLVKVAFVMDGAQIYARSDDTGALDQEDELVIYDGNLPPGPHVISVEMTYKGHGFGVFAYLSGYTFESRSTHTFNAPENGALKLTSVGFERGNITTEMRDRPSVDWQKVPLDPSGRPLPRARGKRSN